LIQAFNVPFKPGNIVDNILQQSTAR